MVVCEAREVLKPELPARYATDYASRRSRRRDTVKLTVCVCLCVCVSVCVSVPAVTAQRLQCNEN